MYLHKITPYFNGSGKNLVFPEGIKGGRVTQVKEEFGYWRKANAIHNWFVINVQNGTDDCGEYLVTKEDLENLLVIVDSVLANNELAMLFLPPKEGFFFGSVDLDDYYFDDLRSTQQIVTEALKSYPEEDGGIFKPYFVYRASW